MEKELYNFINHPFATTDYLTEYLESLSGISGSIIESISGEPMIPEPLWSGGEYLPEILQDISSQPPIITGGEISGAPVYCPSEINIYADDYVWWAVDPRNL